MFDPYRKWLGIPKDQRPPTHYQLLGIAPDEADAEVIDEAAIRQTAHVRAYQMGPHAKDCTKILNELAQARTTLLNPAKRKEYDAQLAASKPRQAQPSAPSQPAADLAFDVQPRVPNAAEKRHKPAEDGVIVAKQGIFLTKPMLYGMIGGAVGLVLLVVLIMVFTRGGSEAPSGPGSVAGVDDGKNAKPPSAKEEGPKEKEPIPAEVVPAPKEVKTPEPPAKDLTFVSETRDAEANVLYRASKDGYGWHDLTIAPDAQTAFLASGQNIYKLDLVRKTSSLFQRQFAEKLRVSPAGNVLAASNGAGIKIFDIPSATLVQDFSSPGGTQIHIMAFSPDNQYFVVGHVGTPEWIDQSKGQPKIVDGQMYFRDADIYVYNAKTWELLKTFKGHTGSVKALAFAANGSLLSTANDKTVRRWDMATGTGSILFKHQEEALLLTPDGKRLAGTSPTHRSIAIYDVDTGALVRRIETGRNYHRLRWTPDGKTLLTSGRTGSGGPKEPAEVIFWDADTAQPTVAAPLWATYLDISPDGRTAVVASEDDTVRLISRPTEPATASSGATPFIDRGAYVEDTRTGLLWQKDGDESGKIIFADAQKYAAKLTLGGLSGWRLPTAKELQAIFPATAPPFVDTKYNPVLPQPGVRGEWTAYWTSESSGDNAVHVTWFSTGGVYNMSARQYFYARCVHDPVTSVVAKAPTLEPMVTEEPPDVKTVPDAKTAKTNEDAVIYRVVGKANLGSATLTADGKVGYFSAGKAVFKVDVPTKTVTDFFPGRTASAFESALKVVVSPDGSVLAAADEQNLSIYDTSTRRNLHGLGGFGQQALAFSPDGQVLMVGAGRKDLNPDGSQRFDKGVPRWESCRVFLCEAPKWSMSKSWPDHLFPPQAMALAEDSSIVSADLSAVRKWFPRVDQKGILFGINHTNLAFTPDGKRLFGTDLAGSTIVTWDIARKTQRPLFKSKLIYRLSVSADGKTLLTAARKGLKSEEGGVLTLWNVATKVSVIRSFDVLAIDQALSADGKIALITAADGTVRLYDRDEK